MQKEKKPANKATLPAEEYLRILRGFKLVNLALVNCQVKSDPSTAREAFDNTDPVPVNISDSAVFEQSADRVIIHHNYSVVSKHGRKTLFSLKADYSLVFEPSEGFSEEFFEAFANLSLPLVTWPYVRELIASMTGRMDLPKLQLGLWRVPFA